jgi:predicted nucleic acid-binding protein
MIVVVSDTSAISALLQTGDIDILRKLYGHILIPDAVRQELEREHSWIPDFIASRPVLESSSLQARLQILDIGEAHAITMAEQIHADLLLIDEKKGRAAADSAGLRYIGLVGALIEAKHRGIISNLTEILDRITINAGFRLSAHIRKAVLEAVKE